MKERIENVTKLIPIIYPIVVFLGYYNYFIYYRFFDLEIFHYLNIYELLFSFISMVIPLFITLFLAFCYLVFVAIIPGTSSELETNSDKDFDDSYLSPTQKRFRKIESNKNHTISLIFNKSHQNSSRSWILFRHKIKKKKYSRAFSHFSVLLSSLISLLIKVTLWFFFILFSFSLFSLLFSPLENDLKHFKPFFTSTVSTILCLIIWSSIIYAIIYKSRSRNKKNIIGFLHIIPLILIVLFSLTYYQKSYVEKTINHKSSDIKFNYKGKIIESNSEIVLLGKTSDYIFLRNLERETNLIFPIKDVTHIEIKKYKEKTTEKIDKEEK